MNDSSAAPDLSLLLAATARGEQAAFAELYAATSSHLFALLLRMLQRRDWAEEALQDAYMRIWKKSESYDPARGVPMAWLSTIARYRALDLLRMRRPEINESQFDEEARPLLDAPDESSGPEDRAAAGEGIERLEQCMKGLTGEQRRSVLLAYYEGYTHTELARRMKAPMGTVKSWVRRGLIQLRDCLGERGMTVRDPQERAADAGEYVLGTLDAGERAAFERDAEADPQLRAEQHRWEARLGALPARLAPVAPRPIVWLNLLQQVAGGGASASPSSARGSRFVQAWASLATAASLVLGFGLYREATRPAPEPLIERVEVPVPAQTFVAYLQVPQSTMFWTVAAAPGQNAISIQAGGEPPAAAKDLDAELWLITKAGDAISLGVIPKTGEVKRSLPTGLAMGEGNIVAVSLEPKGGSPTGKPTGPVVTTAPVMQAS